MNSPSGNLDGLDGLYALGTLTQGLSAEPIRDIAAGVGAPARHSRWITIDQDMIDGFARLTNDHAWLHVDAARAAQSPLGGTISHGFLTLSLVATMAYEVLPKVADARMGMNYGLDKVRFVAPVPVGSRVRGSFELLRVDFSDGGKRADMSYGVAISIEGAAKPALVAQWTRVALF